MTYEELRTRCYYRTADPFEVVELLGLCDGMVWFRSLKSGKCHHGYFSAYACDQWVLCTKEYALIVRINDFRNWQTVSVDQLSAVCDILDDKSVSYTSKGAS